MTEPTKCIDCDNLHGSAREKSAVNRPEYWLCSAHPRISYVHGDEPFMRCRGINAGACPMFRAIPTPGAPPDEQTGTFGERPIVSEQDGKIVAKQPEPPPDPAQQGPLEPAKEAPIEPPPWSVLSAKVLGLASGAQSEEARRKAWKDNAKELHQLKIDNPDEHARLTKAVQAMNEEMKAGDPPF